MNNAEPSPQSLMTDAAGVAKILGVSLRHVQAMDCSGRLGPMGVKFGRCRRWSVAEIQRWVEAGCPPRSQWEYVR
jgi:hypothetical protein